jgi:hypothetical protein
MTFSAKKALAAATLGVASVAASASPTFGKWLCLSSGVGINDDTTACAEAGQADGILYHDDNLGVDMVATHYLEGQIGLATYNSLTSTTDISGITGWRTGNSYSNGLTDLYQMVSAYNDFANQAPGNNPLDYWASFAPGSSGWADSTGSILDTGDFSNPASLTYSFNPTAIADGWAFKAVTQANNVPEPNSVLLVSAAGLGLLAAGRRRKDGLTNDR